MCGIEYKRGEGCAVLYVHVLTIKRVAVGISNVSLVKAISTAASIQRASYVGPTACMYTYEVFVCVLQLCICKCVCVCVCRPCVHALLVSDSTK